MALRMREWSDGEIFICGQMNNSVTWGSPSNTDWPMFALAMKVDPSTLASTFQFGISPTPPSGAPTSIDERGLYSIDVIEDGNNDAWVLLNDYSAGHGNMFWALAHIDVSVPQLNITPGNSLMYWLEFDYAWGNQLAWDGSNLVIIGQQTNNPFGCPPPAPNSASSVTNVNPFLASYTVTASGATGLTASVNDWKLQSSFYGTQTPSADYFTLNGFTQDIGHHYTFAVPPSGSITDWIVVSPVAPNFSGSLYLQYKFNRLDPNRDDLNCNTTSDEAPCHAGIMGTTATNGNMPTFNNETPAFGYENPTTTSSNFDWGAVEDCNTVNKPAGVRRNGATTSAIAKLVLSSNPAHGIAHISLSGSKPPQSKISARIHDAAGRQVASQTFPPSPSGQYAMDVSKLLPGVYLLAVESDGVTRRTMITVL